MPEKEKTKAPDKKIISNFSNKKWTLKSVLILLAIILFLKAAEFLYFSTDIGSKNLNDIAFFTEKLLNQTGFVLKDAQAKGNARTPHELILKTADFSQGMPIYKIDTDEVQRKLNDLPWVKDVEVYRILPNTIKIKIIEHKPIGVWIDKDKKLYPVSSEGILLSEKAKSPDLEHLPMVWGKKGYEKFPEILQIVNTEPELAERVKIFNLVGQRSWKLRFDNPNSGIWVYLPDDNPEQAWHRLKIYEKNHKILKRKLTLIDLRLPDKLIVRLENDKKSNVSDKKGNSKKKRRLKLKEQKA
jgi:cell division protein FtsQ